MAAFFLYMANGECQQERGLGRVIIPRLAEEDDIGSFVIPWLPGTLRLLTEPLAPRWLPACLALGTLEFRLRISLWIQISVLPFTLLQGCRKRRSKRNPRNYYRFRLPMQA